MDKSIIIELAEHEVIEAINLDTNPSIHGFESLFFDNIPPRINNLPRAISFYESLSDEAIEKRYSIHYWESCALDSYMFLRHESMDYFLRSIDKRELAQRQIQNIKLLLNEGNYQIIIHSKEGFLLNEIPLLYEKLVTGTWSNFFIDEELESFESARDKYAPLIYIDHFNADWVAAMQIQSLIWYKELLEKLEKVGTSCYTIDTIDTIEPEKIQELSVNKKNISMNRLKRSNEGYEAIITSYGNFVSKYTRPPQWWELMLFMVENPPTGFNVSGKWKGKEIEELNIEGLKKPVDREAFRKRFERYFRKDNKDNKPLA